MINVIVMIRVTFIVNNNSNINIILIFITARFQYIMLSVKCNCTGLSKHCVHKMSDFRLCLLLILIRPNKLLDW